MKLSCTAFSEGGIIPSIYTCEGENVPPPLVISGVPPEAKSLVLIVDDPDVPSFVRADQMYDHWVLYDIPPQTHRIEQNPPGIQGKNTSGKNGYIGPCPPDREHRYFFKLYAINKKLDMAPGASKKQIEKAMESHILTTCQLMGRYEKGKGY
jgi:Raf kinase inhibitor-like YbhB/YbcL family protein